jgi:heat shock protein HtpX
MKNQLKTILLLGVLSALLVAGGAAFGEGAAYAMLGLAVLMNVGAFFFSDRLVLAMSRAQLLSEAEHPRLHHLVAELAARAGIPKPKIYLIQEAQPNAFATGRSPERGAVAFTQGILQMLNERELRGVVAHELAHIKNRDILVASVAATLAAAISSLGHLGFFFGGHRDDEDGHPAAGLLMMIVAPLAATLVQLGISRSREYLADETAAALTGDPEGLARALEKLELGTQAMPSDVASATASLYIANPFGGLGGMARWLSTHPPMGERIARLRQRPNAQSSVDRWVRVG